VVSVGLRPSETTRQMAGRIGVELNEFGFARTAKDKPGETMRPGVFVAGAFAEPKDIPESVIEASCAAAQVSALLASARGTETRVPEYPPERDVSEEIERVGVFICHCGINIGAVVNVPEVVEYAKGLPGVVYAERNLYTCSQDTQERIAQRIRENHLNRVVVASCTPRTHEPLFQDTLRRAELNPHLFEMANIREQDSWVHRGNPRAATEKAKQLVAMAVAKGRKLKAITRQTFDVDRRALVIGGGLAGLTAARSIAGQGFEVFLVEREAELGGNMRHIFTALPGGPKPQAILSEAIAAVKADPRITLYTGSELSTLGGYRGHFTSTVRGAEGSTIELSHGAVVVATGGRQITPHEYAFGQSPKVIVQRELEERLLDPAFGKGLGGTSVVMIQCVGSREEGHPYCSRICCTQAIKNALAIKRAAPDARVTVLYRDLRSCGFRRPGVARRAGRGHFPGVRRVEEAAGDDRGGRPAARATGSPTGRCGPDAERRLGCVERRHRTRAGEHGDGSAPEGLDQRDRLLPGGARQAAPGGFCRRGYLPGRAGPFAAHDRRNHCPGAGGGGARRGPALAPAPGGHADHRQRQSAAVLRVRHLR
jgi:heterodisulfide reductase subunit A